eukprot:CAMPEP_0174902278 /NCGR_PEP_ID=MMETSP0167-20121228/37422_1 /TAXON_ID=38298 /ORGANISM="Rhodella maculata, Strain CCMP736" /LENGTH=84 /DNA_ID=CAMNT_0016144239 /DNA_START=124 /DNA_END=378 /DNA_ORIENTATION=+
MTGTYNLIPTCWPSADNARDARVALCSLRAGAAAMALGWRQTWTRTGPHPIGTGRRSESVGGADGVREGCQGSRIFFRRAAEEK